MASRFIVICLYWSILIGRGFGVLPVPSKDPWFRPPTGWELTKPGTVLRTRSHAYSQIYIKNCIDTFQVLYRTTDTVGNASWAVTTVFIPETQRYCSESNSTACSHSLVSYQVPYDTVNNDASASYLLQFGEPYGDIGLCLGRGWFVAAPDFEGPLASFTAGVQAGHATLDNVRAVLQVAPSHGLRKDAGYALWGYSGGAQAAGFAAEMSAEYAPELQFAGAVIGGPPPNISNSIPLFNNNDTSGLIPASFLGITIQRPDAYRALLDVVNTAGLYNISGFLAPYVLSGLDSLYYFWDQDIFDYFLNGSDSVWTPTMEMIYNEDGVMGTHGIPNMRLFVYKALHDEFSVPQESDDLVAKYCAEGVSVLYHRNSVGGHNDELTNGRQRALYYLGYVLDGNSTGIEVPKTGCLTVDLTDIENPADIW